MPKKTFFNLPEEKREKIIEMALEEFSKNTFTNASITKVAENAGIAKGSVYQYFNDKKDLYKYIVDLSGQKKFEYLKDCLSKLDKMHFIDLIKELYVKGVEFARDNPRYAGIANNFTKETDVKFKEEILGTNIGKSNAFFEMLIENAKEKGEINKSVDTKVGAYLITSLNTSIVDYMLSQMKYEDILQNTEELLDKVDKMLEILKNGFKA